jgi:hypothetical protein
MESTSLVNRSGFGRASPKTLSACGTRTAMKARSLSGRWDPPARLRDVVEPGWLFAGLNLAVDGRAARLCLCHPLLAIDSHRATVRTLLGQPVDRVDFPPEGGHRAYAATGDGSGWARA